MTLAASAHQRAPGARRTQSFSTASARATRPPSLLSAASLATAAPPPSPSPRLCSARARPTIAAAAAVANAAAAAANDADPGGPRPPARPRVVVVGGGWAGFGAARALTKSGECDVTLLEGAPNPGGVAGGYRDARGRALELGMKGMWYNYPSVYALLRELGQETADRRAAAAAAAARAPASSSSSSSSSSSPARPPFRAPGDWPLTDFTTSGFWGRNGRLITCAPVFSKCEPKLPTLVGQFVHTSNLPWDISLADRLTMLPWLARIADFDASPEVYAEYDRMSARELFRQAGVSQEMYDSFLRPTLLVGLFAEPEDLSAAAVLETLYFYALQNVASFDVCWPRGSIAETIFTPMVESIREARGGQVLGGQVVAGVEAAGGKVTAVRARDAKTGLETRHEADAFVFAVGVRGLKRMVRDNPALSALPELRAAMALRSIDCVATRLWFDRTVATRFPANVLAGFERSAGATFFMLDQLQDQYGAFGGVAGGGDLGGGGGSGGGGGGGNDGGGGVGSGEQQAPPPQGSVVSADFYNASELLPLPDDEIVARVLSHLRECEPGFRAARLVDSAVLRAPEAVTHFAVGSFAARPPQVLPGLSNLFLAGDLVKGVATGANGLSQERAYVTGLSAANEVLARVAGGRGRAAIPSVAEDEPHVAAAKGAARAARRALGPLLALNPLMR